MYPVEMFTVKFYVDKVLEHSAVDVPGLEGVTVEIEATVSERHFEHCAVRFEDENGNGGWILIEGKERGRMAALNDVPLKK